jgi:hypothetical protein
MFAISDDKGNTWERVSFFDTRDHVDSFYHSELVCKECGLTTPLSESVALPLLDGRVLALFRNNEQCLYASASQDNGQSFFLPQKTVFPNDSARFCFGRLPDNRLYYVGNPILNSGRNPLVISISNNEKDFEQSYIIKTGANEKRFQGIAKGGLWGYPHAVVYKNRMFVIYSSQKESIYVSALSIKDL